MLDFLRFQIFSPDKFTKLYIIALSLVAFLTILGQLLVQNTLDNQLTDSWLVNYSGRQRFQSQKIVKDILLLKEQKSFIDKSFYLSDLKKTLSNWEKFHGILSSGVLRDMGIRTQNQNSDTIRKLFRNINPDFQIISNSTHQIIILLEEGGINKQEMIQKYFDLILKHEMVFLKKMDKIVFQYDVEVNEKVKRLRSIEVYLLFLTFFILFIEGFFIFRPAVNAIHKYIIEIISSKTKTTEANNALQIANQQLEESNNLLKYTKEQLLEATHQRHLLEISEQKIRTITLLEGQEDERRRLSRELHDGLGQMLTGLKLLAESIRPDENHSEKEKKSLKKLKELIKETIQETRNISQNLMPPVLSDFGIEAALKELATNYKKNFLVNVSFSSTVSDKRFDKNLEIGLYRIAQEGLNNAVKHAEAKEIEMKILLNKESIDLIIKDNGKGFNNFKEKKTSNNLMSQGLYNLQERARLLDAHLILHSVIGEGTEIKVSLSFKKQTEPTVFII